MFVQAQGQNDNGGLTTQVEQKLHIDHAKEEKQLAEKFKQRADGMFVPSGFDIVTIAKINQEDGKRQKAFAYNKVNHVKSFAENLENTNKSIGKKQRKDALKNKQIRDKINQHPKEDPLPLRPQDIQGDPRISYGTGSTGYNTGFSTSENPQDKTLPKELKLQTLYNLKELHDKQKGNAGLSNDVKQVTETIPNNIAGNSIDASGMQDIGARQGEFKNTGFLTIFDNYKLDKKTKQLYNNKGKLLKPDKKG